MIQARPAAPGTRPEASGFCAVVQACLFWSPAGPVRWSKKGRGTDHEVVPVSSLSSLNAFFASAVIWFASPRPRHSTTRGPWVNPPF